MLKKRRQR